MRNGRARRARRKLVALLDLPEEIDLATPRMTMVGKSDLLLENLNDIIAVTENRIRIGTALGVVSIEGESLSMAELSKERAFVSGKISGWRYEDGV